MASSTEPVNEDVAVVKHDEPRKGKGKRRNKSRVFMPPGVADVEMMRSLQSDWGDIKSRRLYATLVFAFAMTQIGVLLVQVLGLLTDHKFLTDERTHNATPPDALEHTYVQLHSRDTFEYHLLACIQSVLVVFQLAFITRWYILRVRNISYFDRIWEEVPLIYSTQRGHWLFELLILSLHEPPFLVLVWDDAHKLQILSLLRVYTVFAFLRGWSYTLSQGGRLTTTVARISNNKVLQLRIWLREYPLPMISTLTLVGWFLLSIAMYIAEESFLSFDDCMWLTFITMTTVGYGDFSPSTQIGRAVACVTALHGLLSTALLINLMQSFFTLDSQQERVHEFMTEAKLASRVERYAVKVIETAYLARKYPNDWKLGFTMKHLCYRFRKLYRHLKMFKAEMHLTIEPVDLDAKLMVVDKKLNKLLGAQLIDLEPSLIIDDVASLTSPIRSPVKPGSTPPANPVTPHDELRTISKTLQQIVAKQDTLSDRQDKLESILIQLVQKNTAQ